MAKIGVIYGSSRPSVVGEAVAKWYVSKVNNKADFELIDLKEVDLPMLNEPISAMMDKYSQDSTKQWSERIQGFDGLVFIAAEYNNGYTPILKNAIDHLYKEWLEKPVAIISYGEFPASTSAKQLKQIFAYLKMQIVDETPHITPVHQKIVDGSVDESGVHGDVIKLTDELIKLT